MSDTQAESLRFYMTKYANYGTSIVAFSIVQGVAFMILLLTDTTLRAGLLEWQLLVGVLIGTVIVCGFYLWALRVCHTREVNLVRKMYNDGEPDVYDVINGLHRIHVWAIVVSNVLVAIAALTHYVSTVHFGITTH